MAALSIAASTAHAITLTPIGDTNFPTGFVPGFDSGSGIAVGGLSGIAYDPGANLFYSVADDRSPEARFYTLTINLADGQLNAGDVVFQSRVNIRDIGGGQFPNNGVDPEGIALTKNNTVLISSEGEVLTGNVQNPFIREFSLTGQHVSAFATPAKLNPDAAVGQTTGIRRNLALESLTLTPDKNTLFSATENALVQDGPAASVSDTSPARIIQFNANTGAPVSEFLYFTDPVLVPPVPANQFATNGLVDLLAFDEDHLLAVERSFSVGVGNAIKIYEVDLTGATDISGINSLIANGIAGIQGAKKSLLFDLADLGITLDNIEGITFGPTLPDGRQSLILVSDNNFSATQFTQFVAFAINPIPEPATMSLLGLGALTFIRRRR